MSAIKIGPCDELFSLLVRGRVNFTCERCGKYYPEGQRQGLHCSHYFGRRRKSTRWHPLNAFSHCYACHEYLGSNPHVFTQWTMGRLGRDYDKLLDIADDLLKTNASVLHSIRLHLKRELDIMTERRASGEQGRIEFKAWDGTIAESAPRKKKKPAKPFAKIFKRKVSGEVVKRDAA